MSHDSIHGHAKINGAVRTYRVFPDCEGHNCSGLVKNLYDGICMPTALPGFWKPQGEFHPNLVMYSWGTLVGELLRNAPDGKSYHIGGIFMEYENNSGAPVSAPSLARDDGNDYYSGLLSHPTRDYLRIPLTAITLTSTDETLFPGGNRLTAFAQSSGTTGVHGKAFSAAQQSRVFGFAMVAYPDFSDAAQDLIMSRFYYSDPDEQLIKTTGSQIGVEWRLDLL